MGFFVWDFSKPLDMEINLKAFQNWLETYFDQIFFKCWRHRATSLFVAQNNNYFKAIFLFSLLFVFDHLHTNVQVSSLYCCIQAVVTSCWHYRYICSTCNQLTQSASVPKIGRLNHWRFLKMKIIRMLLSVIKIC